MIHTEGVPLIAVSAMLRYSQRDGGWSEAGSVPAAAPVTTSVTAWDELFVIPSGEVRPGIRTPRILAVEF